MPRIRAASLGEHHAMTWASLIDAFNQLIEEQGYETITLRDVAARAGMTRTAVYNYVKDKNQLAAAASAHAASAVVEHVHAVAQQDAPASQRLQEIVRILLEAFRAGPTRAALSQELAAATAVAADTRWRAPFLDVFADVDAVVRYGVEHGEFRPFDDRSVVVDLMAGVVGAAAGRIAQGHEDVDGLAELVNDVLVRALTI